MREYIVTYRDNGKRTARISGYHVSDVRRQFKQDYGNYSILDVKPA